VGYYPSKQLVTLLESAYNRGILSKKPLPYNDVIIVCGVSSAVSIIREASE
jgi:hypothetical protein